MTLPDLIEIRPDVMAGKPCLKGTRIPVYLILEKMGAGESTELLLALYPQITHAHLMAALNYAACLASEETALSL